MSFMTISKRVLSSGVAVTTHPLTLLKPIRILVGVGVPDTSNSRNQIDYCPGP